MQAVSELYTQILADPTHIKEHKVEMAGTTYGHSAIVKDSIKTTANLFSTNGPGIGCAVSRQIEMQIYPLGVIPEAAEFRLFVRVTSESLGASEWLPQGVFYVDVRTFDQETGVLKITGYDALAAYADKEFLDQTQGETGEWPRPMRVVAEQIAARLHTSLDPRCEFVEAFTISYPNKYTMWELLQHIAAAHGGNWIITDAGLLRLIPLGSIPVESSVLIDEHGNAIVIGGDRIYVG